MNIETGEVRDEKFLSAQEISSGNWMRLRGKWAKKYAQKTPVTADDRRRILLAEAKRLRKHAKRLASLASSSPASGGR